MALVALDPPVRQAVASMDLAAVYDQTLSDAVWHTTNQVNKQQQQLAALTTVTAAADSGGSLAVQMMASILQSFPI